MNTGKIRNEFPIFLRKFDGKILIYFDNACTVLKSKSVIKTVSDYYSKLGTCAGNRSGHILSWRVQELVEESREAVKKFINADSSKEIIWIKNSTEGLNLIASSFPFNKTKNEVLLTSQEHHSNLLPFYEQSKQRHFKIRVAASNKTGGLDLNSLKNSICGKTALIAVTHMSNVTGIVNPIKEIASIAHKYGAKILVDDAQYIASHKEDVKANNIDFLVFSGHKIGGPTGIGVLYANEPSIKTLKPFNVGGGVVQSVKIHKNSISADYLPSALRFEAGVQDYAGIIGLNAAICFLNNLRKKININKTIQELSCYALEKLQKIEEIEFLTDYKFHSPSSIISFYFKNKSNSLHDFNLFLNFALKKYFIAVRCGHHCAQPLHNFLGSPISMRLSFFIYNTRSEIDIFEQALKEFLKKGANEICKK